MAYRDILVQADTTPGSTRRLQTAAAVAAQVGADLTGVFMTTQFLRQYMAPQGVAALPPNEIDRLVREHEGAVTAAAQAARATFETAAREAGVTSEWTTVSGDDPGAILASARRSDLVVFPPRTQSSLGGYRVSAGDVALGSGGPVMVTPEEGLAGPVGRRVLVAWNGSREAARALRDALPLVCGAEELHVLVVDPKGEGAPDAGLQRHLERHGCTPNIILDRSEDVRAADVIRDQARGLNVDLIVMGLYGHARVRELMLGGVSRDFLAHPPATLLVSH